MCVRQRNHEPSMLSNMWTVYVFPPLFGNEYELEMDLDAIHIMDHTLNST